MSGFSFDGVAVALTEAPWFIEDGFTVQGKTGLLFRAESVYGKSYAKTAPSALALAKEQIERKVEDERRRNG